MTDGQQEGDGERQHHMKTTIKMSFEWTRMKSQILSPSLLKQVIPNPRATQLYGTRVVTSMLLITDFHWQSYQCKG